MQLENYKRLLDFTAQLESVATTDKERDLINSARGMFAKLEGTGATMDVRIPNGTSASLGQNTFGGTHAGPKAKTMTPEELTAHNADIHSMEKQWRRQVGTLKRSVKSAEHTLERYAEIAPGELDAWVENVLRPTIEEYLASEDGGLMWDDQNQGKVKRRRGPGGFITPAMKRAQYDEDRKNFGEKFKGDKQGKKDADSAKNAPKDDKKEDKKDEKKPDTKPETKATEPKKGKLSGLKAGLKKAAGAVKDFMMSGKVAEESVTTSDLRACFESVFGDSSHLSDDSIKAICFNSVDRLTR